MSRILDGVKPGDWLEIIINGIQTYERVTGASSFLVETEHHKFTRYGRVWPTHKPSIFVDKASKEAAERWLTEPHTTKRKKR